MVEDIKNQNEETRRAWNQNAAFWDARMVEGNDFVNILEWPSIARLLDHKPGERVLDAACGNGIISRRLAGLGAQVTAFDFSEALIELARERQAADIPPIEYHVIDATDEAAMLALGAGRFDAMVCNMALMDIADIRPLMRAAARLLHPGGRFVFTTMHPCFNGSEMDHVGEKQFIEDKVITRYSVKVSRYLTPTNERGLAILGQPALQFYFFRPLHVLFGAAFEAGLVLDGLEEPGFPPDSPPARDPLSWGPTFSEIPPILVARLRVSGY